MGHPRIDVVLVWQARRSPLAMSSRTAWWETCRSEGQLPLSKPIAGTLDLRHSPNPYRERPVAAAQGVR